MTPLLLAETYTYNTLNQLESVTADFGAFQKTYSYTYYPNGLKRTYTNPENVTYTYYYTKHDELAAVQIPGEGQIGLTSFNWLVPQTILLPGGSKVTLTYDQFLQVEERLLTDPADTELARAIYQYGLENNITQIAHSEGVADFKYDNLYRLTDADYPWAAEQSTLASDEGFKYDGVGNRIEHSPGEASPLSAPEQSAATTTLSYDNHNRLSGTTGGASFDYNANGHTSQKVHNAQTTDYIYNREERLIEVRVDGATVGEYSYNPYGQRVRKTANGQTTWFLYNDEGLAAEYDSSGNLIKEYHFKPNSPWMTAPLMQRTASGQVYYYQNDHLGTPQRMVDKSGAVVWEARYEAFGKAEVVTGLVENNLRFSGQYFDSESGLHHNYFRDYDSGLGRYLQSDPIGLRGGLNTYAYTKGNPLYYTDPLGLKGWLPLISDSTTVAKAIVCLRLKYESRELSENWHEEIWGIYHEQIALNEENYRKDLDKHCSLIRNSCAKRDACYDKAREDLNEANEQAWEMLDSKLERGDPYRELPSEICGSPEEPVSILPGYPVWTSRR